MRDDWYLSFDNQVTFPEIGRRVDTPLEIPDMDEPPRTRRRRVARRSDFLEGARVRFAEIPMGRLEDAIDPTTEVDYDHDYSYLLDPTPEELAGASFTEGEAQPHVLGLLQAKATLTNLCADLDLETTLRGADLLGIGRPRLVERRSRSREGRIATRKVPDAGWPTFDLADWLSQHRDDWEHYAKYVNLTPKEREVCLS